MRPMSTRGWTIVVVLLFIIILAMALVLIFVPAPTHAPTARQATSTATSSQPLHERVAVSQPRPGDTVAHTLIIKGVAPGNWYFEASFPIKVTTPSDVTIGTGHAQAQADWMTTALVPFSATIQLAPSYSGPATVALLRDNPSGMPQNDDSLEIPVVVQ